jgi:hypothetical protein
MGVGRVAFVFRCPQENDTKKDGSWGANESKDLDFSYTFLQNCRENTKIMLLKLTPYVTICYNGKVIRHKFITSSHSTTQNLQLATLLSNNVLLNRNNYETCSHLFVQKGLRKVAY